MSAPERIFQICYRWGGEPIAEEERATLSLSLRGERALLQVNAPYAGDPPPPGPPGHCFGLWTYEVVELFVASEARPERYLELELGPHGHFLALSFEEVRAPNAHQLSAAGAASYRSEQRGARWSARLSFPQSWLPPAPWRGCAFSIAGVDGARRHLLSSPLPGEVPDFHQPTEFPPLPLLSPVE